MTWIDLATPRVGSLKFLELQKDSLTQPIPFSARPFDAPKASSHLERGHSKPRKRSTIIPLLEGLFPFHPRTHHVVHRDRL